MLLGASNARETMYPKINFCERLTDRQVMHKTNIDSKKRWQQSRMKPSKAPAPFLYSSIRRKILQVCWFGTEGCGIWVDRNLSPSLIRCRICATMPSTSRGQEIRKNVYLCPFHCPYFLWRLQKFSSCESLLEKLLCSWSNEILYSVYSWQVWCYWTDHFRNWIIRE